MPKIVGVAVTQEFHLCVTHIEQNTYRIWTEHVPIGVPLAEECVEWRVSDWLVEAQSLSMQDTHSFGQKLYTALFAGSIADSWNIAKQHQDLCLHLKICDRTLARLPWKLISTVTSVPIELYDPHQDDTDVNLEASNAPLLNIDRDDATYAEDAGVVFEIFSQLNADPENTAQSSPIATNSVMPNTREKRASIALIIGTMIMFAVAIGNSLWEQHQPLTQGVTTQIHPNLQTASTAQITKIAIAQLQQQNAIAAQQPIEELLNRKALQSANTALNAVPQNLADTDILLFLRGRLAWQSSQVEQAKRDWQAAVQHKPDSTKYHNALGFAYYAQGNLNQASEAWFEALYLGQRDQTTLDQEMLTAYAGLALVMYQSAQNPAAESAKLTNEAIALCRKVIAEDSVGFQPQQLHNSWLWHPQAITDWRSLLNRSIKS